MTDWQVAEEIAVAVAEALARSQWSDGPTRVQHARQAVVETLDRCKVRLEKIEPPGERPRLSSSVLDRIEVRRLYGRVEPTGG